MEETHKEKSKEGFKQMNMSGEVQWRDYEEMLKLEVYIEEEEEEEEEEGED